MGPIDINISQFYGSYWLLISLLILCSFWGHYFIKLLEEKGKLSKYFTQNIDGLERLAGVDVNKKNYIALTNMPLSYFERTIFKWYRKIFQINVFPLGTERGQVLREKAIKIKSYEGTIWILNKEVL